MGWPEYIYIFITVIGVIVKALGKDFYDFIAYAVAVAFIYFLLIQGGFFA